MTRPKVPDDKRIRTAQACESCKRRKQKVSISSPYVLSDLEHWGSAQLCTLFSFRPARHPFSRLARGHLPRQRTLSTLARDRPRVSQHYQSELTFSRPYLCVADSAIGIILVPSCSQRILPCPSCRPCLVRNCLLICDTQLTQRPLVQRFATVQYLYQEEFRV